MLPKAFPFAKHATYPRLYSLAPRILTFVMAATVSSSTFASAAPVAVAAVPRDVVTKPRTIVQKFESVAQTDGDGASVRRSIGRPELPRLDPFLMLDEFNVAKPGGFPPHPHRGQSTVTYMISGKFEHEDFKGHKGTIGPGDLQWMTAGRGILHSELPVGTEPGRGLQLWINLPRANKLVEPDYQELLASDIPKASLRGVTATVIAGSAFGVESPVRTKYTPTHYLDFHMEPNAVLTQSIPAGWNGFIYVISGKGMFGASAEPDSAAVSADGSSDVDVKVSGGSVGPAHHTLVLSNKGTEDGIVVKAGETGVRFVLIAGQPTNEPVVQHGPFVMTTRDEIRQAFIDYQEEKNGFEGAHKFSAEWDARH